MKQFKDKYDCVQQQLQNLAVMDDFLAGMCLYKCYSIVIVTIVECKCIQLLCRHAQQIIRSDYSRGSLFSHPFLPGQRRS